MVTYLARIVTLTVVLGFIVEPHCAKAQDTRGSWQDAVRLVDSGSPADIAAAIDKLQPLVAADRALPPPAIALTTVAMCQLRQQDYEAAAKMLERIARENTAAQQGLLRGANLRMSLLVALVRDDAATADSAFKDLVRMVVAAQGDPVDFKLNAHVIGTVVGMLSFERAKSPVAVRILKIGNDQLMSNRMHGIATQYQSALEIATERAEALVANLARIDKEGLDAVVADLEQRQQVLKQRANELKEQKELTGEVVRNTREQFDQNTRDMRQLAGSINRINQQLRQPTPGHPGPKRAPPPPLPSPRSIVVNEFEVVDDYEYVQRNGQSVRVPVTRQVRRSQSEIDRERNFVYERMRDEFNRNINDYRAYEATYNASLASWSTEDQRRRRELNDEKADLELKRNNLAEANKSIKIEKKDSAAELRVKRTEAEQEEFDVELLEIAVDAARSGSPHNAFRPQHFESLNWTLEKVLLQKL